jgi:hypothetical protein
MHLIWQKGVIISYAYISYRKIKLKRRYKETINVSETLGRTISKIRGNQMRREDV